MDVDKPLSGYKYQASPKYNSIDYRNFQTPKINIKNETSENILNQTKESLNNFLINLKKSSILKNNNEINDVNIISGLSSISNINNIEGSNESYNIKKLGAKCRSVICLKNRYGEADAADCLYFDGLTGCFRELSNPEKIYDYDNIFDSEKDSIQMISNENENLSFTL